MKDKNVPGNPQIPSSSPLRSIKDKALTSLFSFATEGTVITLGGPPLVTWLASLTSKPFHVAFLRAQYFDVSSVNAYFSGDAIQL